MCTFIFLTMIATHIILGLYIYYIDTKIYKQSATLKAVYNNAIYKKWGATEWISKRLKFSFLFVTFGSFVPLACMLW